MELVQTSPPARGVSDAIREGLQFVLDLRRASLTKQEIAFLTGLLEDGSEEEITRASEKLSNPYLFPSKSKSQDEDDDKKDEITPSSSYGSSNQVALSSCTSRRRESLHLRKSSAVHSQIWKAHQNGLAVSSQASRRSILQKEESISRLSLVSGMQSQRRSTKHRFTESFMSSITALDWDSDDESNDKGEIVATDILNRPTKRTSMRGSTHLGGSLQMTGNSQRFSNLSKSWAHSSIQNPIRISTNRRRSSLTLGSVPTESIPSSGTSQKSMPLRRSVTLAVTNEVRKQERIRRPSALQKPLPPINRMQVLDEDDERDSPNNSPKSERVAPELKYEELGLPEEKEEKKMNDEAMVDSQEQEFLQHISVRRASENTYKGEGMEVGLSPYLQQQLPDDVMSESETYQDEEEDDVPADSQLSHAMFMRRASMNTYNGEGMEIADWDLQEEVEDRKEYLQSYRESSHHLSAAIFEEEEETPASNLKNSSSFCELQSMDRVTPFPGVEINQGIKRSYSEDELAAALTVNMHFAKCKLEKRISDGTAATVPESDDEEDYHGFEYDGWGEEVNDGLNNLPFRILGTSVDDVDSHPHVLSPPLMESLQAFMPVAKTSDNYWMKYSMVRDGASIHTLLQHARGAKYSILALETVDGEVMGSFTNEPWRKTWSYFGGGESFLWRMRHSRKSKCSSIIDVAHLESEIDVYPYTGENHCVQFCTSRKIAVGGGTPDQIMKCTESLPAMTAEGDEIRDHDWGYGIALQSDLMHGSSSPCVTFRSPSLSKLHSDGSIFEIINVELWTMTPCYSEADAEKLELGQMFLEHQSFRADQSNEDLNVNELFG